MATPEQKFTTITKEPLTDENVVTSMEQIDEVLRRCQALLFRYPASVPLQKWDAELTAQMLTLEALNPGGA